MKVIVWTLFALLSLANIRGLAEETPKITVNATASVPVVPTAIEIVIQTKGKGESAKAAVDALKATREKISAKLTELGAAAEPAKEDPPSVADTTQNDRAMQMRMMRSGGRLKKAPAKAEAKKPSIEMQQVVHIRVPLKGKDVTEVTVEAEDFKAKVKTELAKLLEEKKEAKPGEAEEGKEEEGSEEVMDMGGYNNNEQQGPIHFVFFAPLSEETRNKALAESFKKAQETALRTAKAMGKNVAEVQSVQIANSQEEQMMAAYQQMYGYDRWGRPRGQGTPSDGLVGATPALSMSSLVTVTFTLK